MSAEQLQFSASGGSLNGPDLFALDVLNRGSRFAATRIATVKPPSRLYCFSLLLKQGGSGTETEPETGTVGTVFSETKSGTGTAGTVLEEPEPERRNRPVELYWNTEKNFLQKNRRNREPEPLEPFHPCQSLHPLNALSSYTDFSFVASPSPNSIPFW